MQVQMKVNGKSVSVDAAPNTLLVTALREHLKLTGTHVGCDTAQCGACTVHLNGNPVRSCTVPVSTAAGQKITTIEGLSTDNTHAVQLAWIQEQVPQCGYCQAGQIMTAAGLLKNNPHPSDQEIIDGMSGNICRCGTYQRIREAVKTL